MPGGGDSDLKQQWLHEALHVDLEVTGKKPAGINGYAISSVGWGDSEKPGLRLADAKVSIRGEALLCDALWHFTQPESAPVPTAHAVMELLDRQNNVLATQTGPQQAARASGIYGMVKEFPLGKKEKDLLTGDIAWLSLRLTMIFEGALVAAFTFVVAINFERINAR